TTSARPLPAPPQHARPGGTPLTAPRHHGPAALSRGPPAAGALRQPDQPNPHPGRQTHPGVKAQA
ncbi:MAG: hypothetical protein ACK5EA_06275, partial [Planctomycetaceae bacterium]